MITEKTTVASPTDTGNLKFWLDRIPTEQARTSMINILSERFGVTERTIYNIMNGSSYMSPLEVTEACRLLGIKEKQLINPKP